MLPFLPAAGLPLANVTKMDCRKDAELYFCRICVQQTHRGRSLEKGAAAGGARAAWRTDGDKIAGGNVTCARLQRKADGKFRLRSDSKKKRGHYETFGSYRYAKRFY